MIDAYKMNLVDMIISFIDGYDDLYDIWSSDVNNIQNKFFSGTQMLESMLL